MLYSYGEPQGALGRKSADKVAHRVHGSGGSQWRRRRRPFLFFPMAEALKSNGSDKVENNHKWINENSYIWSQDLPLELEYGICNIHGDKLTDYNGTLQNYKGKKTYCFDRNLLLLKDNWFGGFCHLGHYSNDIIIRNIFFEKLKKYYDCDKYLKNINKLHAVKEEWESPIFNTLF